MITDLHIRNLGVIESADLEFDPGLTVLTGETGAGKTMVLTSLQLLIGQRADTGAVRVGSARAEVDGVFDLDAPTARRVEALGLVAEEGELIISRTVASQGRSRAHLGGRPVPVSLLAEVGDGLVTIHGQADQMRLRRPAVQRETLDAYGGEVHATALGTYRRAWDEAVEARKERDAGHASAAERESEAASLAEALDAITALAPREGEDEELLAETRRLTNIEDLRQALERAGLALGGAEDAPGAVELVRQAVASLRDGLVFDPDLGGLADRLASTALDLDAALDEIQGRLDELRPDPQRLAEVHERRAALRELMVGRASDAAGLIEWARRASERLEELTSPSLDPRELDERLRLAQQRVLTAGADLTRSRAGLAGSLSADVDTELHALAMRGAHLEVRLTPRKPGPHGLEDIEFLMQAHPDMPMRPLSQGASGGELSRIMLALEVVLGRGAEGGTFIFDEVDAGIGGRTATEVGARLARLARGRQVLVVTHLAQVAAFADHHFVVDKQGATTSVRRVNGGERIAELARMMGGGSDSDAARRHAMELIEGAVVPPWEA
jgi:DNA repair protein RecN (Recombination protein N)